MKIDWAKVTAEYAAMEAEALSKKPVSRKTLQRNLRIERKLKSGMDASEVDVAVNNFYK